ncbi:MAG TPA: alpha/beta hydrolase [Ktedonobacterales bacterium]|nr:alpha/beta hydrolase [Ktedonobacterales bacterium]
MGGAGTDPILRRAHGSDVTLHVREWAAGGGEAGAARTPMLLLHGLASASRIWDLVAPLLAHDRRVVSLDQRGHGLSDKPDDGYDFATIIKDDLLAADELGLGQRFHLAGHSWGANVALELAAAHPERVASLSLVDGGFGMLRQRPGATWETTSRDLAPPDFAGTPRETFLGWVRKGNPNWRPELEDIMLNIVELRPDDTVGPRLARANHMKILRAMWDEDPIPTYQAVRCPVLFVMAEQSAPDARGEAFLVTKRQGIESATRMLANAPRVETRWMRDTIHDIPLQRPDELAASIASFVAASE